MNLPFKLGTLDMKTKAGRTAGTIVSQLDKCLIFKSFQGDKNDCIPYKITPRNAVNFRHLSSCDTIVVADIGYMSQVITSHVKLDLQVVA